MGCWPGCSGGLPAVPQVVGHPDRVHQAAELVRDDVQQQGVGTAGAGAHADVDLPVVCRSAMPSMLHCAGGRRRGPRRRPRRRSWSRAAAALRRCLEPAPSQSGFARRAGGARPGGHRCSRGGGGGCDDGSGPRCGQRQADADRGAARSRSRHDALSGPPCPWSSRAVGGERGGGAGRSGRAAPPRRTTGRSAGGGDPAGRQVLLPCPSHLRFGASVGVLGP